MPVVQYMYSICTVFVRFGSVQILYKYCTYTVQRTEQVVVYSGLDYGKKKVLLRGVRDEAQGATALGDADAEAVISSR